MNTLFQDTARRLQGWASGDRSVAPTGPEAALEPDEVKPGQQEKPARSSRPRSMGIALRTALFSWVITSVTVLILVSAIIPQQKRIFQENLASKAHGITVSLHDTAAGAAVNEDYSSIVDLCGQILDGDKTIDYLVITKNDGESQILQQQKPRWHQENLGPHWRPSLRLPHNEIAMMPDINRRVFNYSLPFDYQGIQWGWMHVGLSLASYDRSVRMVYRDTGLLALVCILLGLVASVIYAQRLTRPILDLRSVVRKVAAGDLRARVQADRTDELGSLARSINLMTESLLHKDSILQSVRIAAQEFLSTSDWKQVVAEVLAKIGDAAQVSYLRVFENSVDGGQTVQANLRHEWIMPTARPFHHPPGSLSPAFPLHHYPEWVSGLQQRQMIAAQIGELTPLQKQALGTCGVQSILLMPIMVDGRWWGFVALADCLTARQWTDAERDSVRAVAEMLGAAISRQRNQDALLEAKLTLEQRVDERTMELQALVRAKDRAHAELAEAQSRLVQASRQAGMAEVATGVLHNVGNVLNSVNVSSALIRENLRRSEIASLVKITALLQQHAAHLPEYLSTDPKGRLVAEFLTDLTVKLGREHDALLRDHDQLARNIEHVKEIVAMQQSYARVSGVLEKVILSELVDDTIRMNLAGLTRHGVQVIRRYAPVPEALVDKHKLLQILVNLVHNAKYALDGSTSAVKELVLEVAPVGPDRFQIVVADNGIGIAPENLTRIFSHGFTTRKDGHGFGLHSGANAAKEMGGTLAVRSAGLGQGATFTIELPLEQQRTKR